MDPDRQFQDDFDLKNLLSDDQESEITLLTEMVRNHYLNYLEKQLMENYLGCYHPSEDEPNEVYKSSIKCAAKLLEHKAIEACRIAQRYQRAMVKIIAIVRRSTQENRLIEPLEKSISDLENDIGPQNKETQTEAGLEVEEKTKKTTNKIMPESSHCKNPQEDLSLDEEPHEMTLDEKIEIFQKHLINGKNPLYFARSPLNKAEHKSEHTKRNHHHQHHHLKTKPQNYHQRLERKHHNHHRPYKETKHKVLHEDVISPTSTVITPIRSPAPTPVALEEVKINKVLDDMDISNDSVAEELARMFSEEKTELDEIFGIDPNQEPDDPQICKILKEIEEAKVSTESLPNNSRSIADESTNLDETHSTTKAVLGHSVETPSGRSATKTVCIDLSKSLWPCELFMQKRKLSESLARLIEEDLRWHEIIKWKFFELFGEDSDDEFTPCSPSIELDEILMGSCVKRISPWVVKHLMKPMKHGLIGNRFVFKKLAKHIARSIITENQYPDESIIKGCVENYFCLHQAVMTMDDLQDVPSISII